MTVCCEKGHFCEIQEKIIREYQIFLTVCITITYHYLYFFIIFDIFVFLSCKFLLLCYILRFNALLFRYFTLPHIISKCLLLIVLGPMFILFCDSYLARFAFGVVMVAHAYAWWTNNIFLRKALWFLYFPNTFMKLKIISLRQSTFIKLLNVLCMDYFLY